MVPGGLKNVLHDKNWTFSTQVFSCRFFSSRFSWPFKDFKDSTPKITFPAYKSDFHWQSNAFLWFDFKTHGLLIKEEKRKIILLREIYLLARCFMLNWSRTAAYSHVSLPIKIGAQRKAGRGKRVPCTSSPVTRVSRSPLFETMRKTKRLRRRLDRGDTRLYLPLNMKSMERFFNTVLRTFSRKNR